MIDVLKRAALIVRQYMESFPGQRLRRVANALIISVTVCAVVAALGLATLLVLVPRVFGLENLVIATGSMSPAFNAGDVALVDDDVQPDSVRMGDVITYNGPGGVVTTHRVVSIETRDGTPLFSTKGDANDSPDDYLVPADALLARAEARLPYMGWLVDFMKQRNVAMVAVLVPAALIVLNELLSLRKMLLEDSRRRSI